MIVNIIARNDCVRQISQKPLCIGHQFLVIKNYIIIDQKKYKVIQVKIFHCFVSFIFLDILCQKALQSGLVRQVHCFKIFNLVIMKCISIFFFLFHSSLIHVEANHQGLIFSKLFHIPRLRAKISSRPRKSQDFTFFSIK